MSNGTLRRELIEQLQAAASVEELHRCGTEIAGAYGFDHFIYGASIPTSFVQPQAVIISGYPQDWRDHYIANAYQRIDPTVHHCARRLTPLTWSDISVTDRAAQKLLHECRDFGLASGTSLPTHGRNGEFAMLSLASRHDSADSAAQIERSLADTHLLAAHFHETASRILSLVQIPGTGTLSEREKECLLWSAEGKTSWEISQILGISERTVVFHLQHATEKLKVSNRQHAVARAIALGLISPQYT
jgi:DNA-binding CsgD family transcriptional regulator